MRTNAIVRIVLFSLCILILTGLLLGGLGIWAFSVDWSAGKISEGTLVQESDSMLVQEAVAEQISSIKIDWAAGNIRIEPSEDTATIQVKETEVSDKYKMICKVTGSTLSIQFSKPNFGSFHFGVDGIAKDLIITVPAGWTCKTLELDVAAANVEIRDLTIGKLDFDGASGFCNLENCHVTDVDVDAASGDLKFSGTLENMDFDGASADCQLMLTNCPGHIDMDGMSGELDITLPSDCGFTVSTEGLSNDFSTDFETTTRGGAHVHGDGSCLIEVDALSGSVAIHDGGYNCHDGQESHHDHH